MIWTECISKIFSAVYERIFLKFGGLVCPNEESRMHKYDVILSKVKVTGSQKVKICWLKYLSHLSIDLREIFMNYFLSHVLLVYVSKIWRQGHSFM